MQGPVHKVDPGSKFHSPVIGDMGSFGHSTSHLQNEDMAKEHIRMPE